MSHFARRALELLRVGRLTCARLVKASPFPATPAPDTKYYSGVDAVVDGNETSNCASAAWDLPNSWQVQEMVALSFADNATFNNGVFAVAAAGDERTKQE